MKFEKKIYSRMILKIFKCIWIYVWYWIKIKKEYLKKLLLLSYEINSLDQTLLLGTISSGQSGYNKLYCV